MLVYVDLTFVGCQKVWKVCGKFELGGLMKNVLKMAAVALLALGISSERVDANATAFNNLTGTPIGTSLGTFNLSSFDPAATVSFDLVAGSWGFVTGFDTAGSEGNLSPARTILSTGSGGWSENSFLTSAQKYAEALATLLAGSSNGGIFNAIDPNFPVANAIYFFASSLTPAVPNVSAAKANGWFVATQTTGSGTNVTVGNTVEHISTPDIDEYLTSVAFGGDAQSVGYYYASLPTTGQEVPEIDGPVLAQVGFVLAGLYFVLLGYRRREDGVDVSRTA